MPVPPEERVCGEKGGHDAELLHRVELVFAGELRVDCDGTVIGSLVSQGLRHALDHQIDGGVAIGVRQHRNASAEHARHLCLVVGRIDARVRNVVGGGTRWALDVGLGQPGRASLGRSVERELDARDPNPVLVFAAMADRLDRCIQRHRVDMHERSHVERQGCVGGDGTQASHELYSRRPILDRGDAVARVVSEGALQFCRESLGGALPHDGGQHRKGRRFFEHAVGLARARPASDHATRRVRRLRGQADLGECGGIERHQMSGYVHQPDRMPRGDAIEVVPRRVSAFGQQRIVVTEAEQPFARRHVALADPLFERGHDVVDALHRSDRRWGEVDEVEGAHHQRQVAVCVDEAGCQRALFQLDDARVGSDVGAHFFSRTDGDDVIAANRDAARVGVGRVDGQEVLAEEHEVCGRAGALAR